MDCDFYIPKDPISVFIESTCKGEFLIYNNGGEKNILFLGSCRLISLLLYFQLRPEIRKNYNIYYVAVFKTTCEMEAAFCRLLTKVDIVVADYIHNYGVFNTEKNVDKCFDRKGNLTGENIHHAGLTATSTFFLMPHLDCQFSISSVLESDAELRRNLAVDRTSYFPEVKARMQRSLEYLRRNISLSSLPELGELIFSNFKHRKLYLTVNHPTFQLALWCATLCLQKLFDLQPSDEDIERVKKLHLLEGMEQKLCQEDIDLHGFTYPVKLFPINDILEGQFFFQPEPG